MITSFFNNVGNGNSLVRWGGDSLAIGVTSRWPPRLQVVSSLAGANSSNESQLARDESTSLGGADSRVEVWLDVGGDDVNDAAKGTGRLLELVQRLGGGAWAGVTSSGPGGLGLNNESCEGRGGAVVVEDSLVTDDNHGNHVPVTTRSPGGDLLDLRTGIINTGSLDEDTEDELHAVLLGGSTDVDETGAIGGVKTDSGETLSLDRSYININLGGSLALASAVVWSVSHGPFLSVNLDSGSGGGWFS